ncbi:phosphatase PAP2 family protein [Streptomyces sp. NPDC001514]
MPRDRRDRPTLTTQCVGIHVFLPREHPGPRTGRTRSSCRLSSNRTPIPTRRARSHEGRGDQKSTFGPPQSIGWPRVHSGAHYLSDVAAGAAIGLTAAWLVHRAPRLLLRHLIRPMSRPRACMRR